MHTISPMNWISGGSPENHWSKAGFDDFYQYSYGYNALYYD